MDPNIIALWFAGFQALRVFSRSARAARQGMGWTVVSALVLLTGAVGWLRFRESVGYVTFALTALLIMLPWWAHGVAARALKRSQYRRAYRFASIAAVLHPLRWLARIAASVPRLRAGAGGQDRRGGGAALSASPWRRQRGGDRPRASAQDLGALGRDQGLGRARRASAQLSADPSLLMLYLRALGELEESHNLAEFMLTQESTLLSGGGPGARLSVLVRVHRPRGAGPPSAGFGELRATTKRRAKLGLRLASLHAGNFEQARHAFSRLRQSKNAVDP